MLVNPRWDQNRCSWGRRDLEWSQIGYSKRRGGVWGLGREQDRKKGLKKRRPKSESRQSEYGKRLRCSICGHFPNFFSGFLKESKDKSCRIKSKIGLKSSILASTVASWKPLGKLPSRAWGQKDFPCLT